MADVSKRLATDETLRAVVDALNNRESVQQAKAEIQAEGAAQVDNVTAAAEEITGKVAQIDANTDGITQLRSDLVNLATIKTLNYWDGTTWAIQGYIIGNKFNNANGLYTTNPVFLNVGNYLYVFNKNELGTNAHCAKCNNDGTNLVQVTATNTNERTAEGYYIVSVNITEAGYYRFNLGSNPQSTFMIVEGTEASDYPTTYIEPQTKDVSIKENVIIPQFDEYTKKVSTVINPLYGKKLSVNGDSICYGAGYLGGYAKIIGENNNMTVQNIGVSGGTISAEVYKKDGVTPRHWISRTISDMDIDSDYIIIEGGVNDSENPNHGEITTGYCADLDDTTFYGAVESTFKQLVKRFKGKKYGFIIVHQMSFGMQPGNKRYNAIKECATKWGVPILDLSLEIPPIGYFTSEEGCTDSELIAIADTYTRDNNGHGDGWHPNEEGYRKYYVPKIEAWLKNL